MIGSFRAEWIKVSNRLAYRVVAIVWGVFILALYLGAYLLIANLAPPDQAHDAIGDLLPPTIFRGPFTSLATPLLMVIAVMVVGGEFGWGTLKTTLTQRPGRLTVIGGKFLILLLILIIFTGETYLLMSLGSLLVGALSGFGGALPAAGKFAQVVGAFMLGTGAWMALGATLAMLMRGTGFAIGLTLVYSLIVENIFHGLALTATQQNVSFLQFIVPINNALIGTNATLLSNALICNPNVARISQIACGSTTLWQPITILFVYIVVLVGISLALIRVRNVD